jgi:hypothetical protein
VHLGINQLLNIEYWAGLMGSLILFHDIGTVKNTLFQKRHAAESNMAKRINKVYGSNVNPNNFHVVQIHQSPERFSIRHKETQLINNVTIEPFFIYGVEYFDTCYENPFLKQRYVRNRFDTLVEAINYAKNLSVQSACEAITMEKKKPKPKSPEQLQKEAFGGNTIFDLTNLDFDKNRADTKAAIKSQNQDQIQKLEAERRQMRSEIWGLEDLVNKCFESNDFSDFSDNPLFPELCYRINQHINSFKKAG